MSAIKVENLSYSYPGVEPGQSVKVFENLDLQIEQGSFVAILGSNGSGKSTLGKALAEKMGREFLDSDAVIEKEEKSFCQSK